MLLTTVLMAATVLQTAEEMDGVERRRIYEAGEAARLWARWKTEELFPTRLIANETNPERRAYISREARECEYVLRACAVKHVAEAYKVKPGLLKQIADDWYSAQMSPHVRERNDVATIDPNSPAWERKGTLFDPAKVNVPAQYKKRFGYKYPDAHAKAKKFDRRSPSQDIKDRLLSSPGPSASPRSEGSK